MSSTLPMFSTDCCVAPSAPSARLLLTMGDAAGIGPEIVVKALGALPEVAAVVVGDLEVMRRAVRQLGLACAVAQLRDLADGWQLPAGLLGVWSPPGLPQGLAQRPQGQVDALCGQAAAQCVRAAVRAIMEEQADALVTAPLHKMALVAAGESVPGHTELLQMLTAAPQVRMMLSNTELRVVLVTVHLPLREAIEQVTTQRVFDTILMAHRSGFLWGQASPRIAVAGLNPHAGEGGRFGHEDQVLIAPAVEAARRQGIWVQGPIAPDTVFMRARQSATGEGEFDVVIAMYHDQGLIPVKYLGLEHGVNTTLGLPFVRTSPDHGTAFDLVGRQAADPASLIAAIQAAQAYALAARRAGLGANVSA